MAIVPRRTILFPLKIGTEEKIIKDARHYSAIYDMNHIDYTNEKVKNDIWENISDQLKLKKDKLIHFYTIFLISLANLTKPIRRRNKIQK